MNSSWRAEISAIFAKEWLGEMRSRTGLTTAGLFGIVTVFTISFSAFNESLDGSIAAGLLWVAVLFSSVISLPRTFIAEEEQRTGDLLRLLARPHAVFWGKALFNLAQVLAMALILSFLFVGFTGERIVNPGTYLLTLVGGCFAISGATTLCGAIVSRAANRMALAGAIAIPVLLPIMALGVGGTRVGFGSGIPSSGVLDAMGLLAYAVATLSVGPWIFAAVWKN